MQKLSHEVQLERSSDEEESNSDFDGRKFSHCEGCYISRGSSNQCGIHGYGGAPLQGKAIKQHVLGKELLYHIMVQLNFVSLTMIIII